MSSKTTKSQLYSVTPEKTSVIFLAELIRALEILKPENSATQAAIGKMLGFEWVLLETAAEDESSELKQEEVMPEAGTVPSAPLSKTALPDGDEPRQPLQHVEEEKGNWLPVTLSESGGDVALQMQLDLLPESEGNMKYIPPAFEPLLAPRLTRGILSGALSTISEDGAVNIDELVQMIARRDRLEQVPRLSVPTLRRGVQLLIDRGEGMTPYAQDQLWLEKRVRDVVGPELLEVIRFSGCPSRPPKTRLGLKAKPYVYPHPGTLIVLMTDLGIRQLRFSQSWASELEWEGYLQGTRRAGCPVLALVPYAPDRWPPALARLCKIIQWDRSTNSNNVRSVIGIAHEARR